MTDSSNYSIRHAVDAATAARHETGELRDHFHVGGLFEPDKINLIYSHFDRMIVGGATPSGETLPLEAIRPTGTKGFLDRRELVAVNIGGGGSMAVDGERHALAPRDMLYVGMGSAVIVRLRRSRRTRRNSTCSALRPT